jgi:hypothetical protein
VSHGSYCGMQRRKIIVAGASSRGNRRFAHETENAIDILLLFRRLKGSPFFASPRSSTGRQRGRLHRPYFPRNDKPRDYQKDGQQRDIKSVSSDLLFSS